MPTDEEKSPVTRVLTSEEAEITASTVNRFLNYYAYHTARFQKFKEFYKIARFYRDPNHAYKYNVSKPIAFTFAENFTSSITNVMFEKPDFWNVMPVEGSNLIGGQNGQVLDEAISRQLERAMNVLTMNPDRKFFEETEDYVKSAAWYGNGISWVLPEFKRDKETGENKYVGPMLRHIDIFDVLPNPNAHRLEPGIDLFIREKTSFYELKRTAEQKGYKNIEMLKSNVDFPDDIKRELIDTLGLGAIVDQDLDKNQSIHLIHHFRQDGHVVTIGNLKVPLRDTSKPTEYDLGNGVVEEFVMPPLPYYPFDMLKLNPSPKEFYGVGIVELSKQIQESMNRRGSQRDENIEIVLQKPLIVNSLYDLDPDSLYTGPGHVIVTNDVDRAIKPLEFNDITSSSYQEDGQDLRLAEEATGVSEISRGTVPEQRTTATTTSILNTNANKRNQTVLRRAGFMQSSIGKKIAIQIRNFMTKDDYERIIGEPDAGFFNLSSEAIVGGFDIKLSNTSLGTGREQRAAAQIQFLTGAAQVNSQAPGTINLQQAVRWVAEDLFPDRNIDQLVPKPNPIPPSITGGGVPGAAAQGITPPAGISNTPNEVGNALTDPSQILQLVQEGRLGGQQGG